MRVTADTRGELQTGKMRREVGAAAVRESRGLTDPEIRASLGKNIPGRGKSRCEGPEIRQALACPGNHQEDSGHSETRRAAGDGSTAGLPNLVTPDVLHQNIPAVGPSCTP